MTPQRDIASLLDLWLAEGSTVAPDRVIDVVTDRIERQRQRGAWRFPAWEIRMPALVRLAALATALAIVAAGAMYLAGSSRPSVAPPSPGPSPTAATTTEPSPSPYILPSELPGWPYATAHTFSSMGSRPGFRVDVPTAWDTFAGSSGGGSMTFGLIHTDDGDAGNVAGSILVRWNPVLGNVASCPDDRTAPPTPGLAAPASSIVATLLADSRFTVVAAPAIQVDGRPAQVLDVQLAPGFTGSCGLPGPSALLLDEPGSFVVLDGDRQLRLILLEVDGTPLVILIYPQEEAFDAFVARGMALVSGITFLP